MTLQQNIFYYIFSRFTTAPQKNKKIKIICRFAEFCVCVPTSVDKFRTAWHNRPIGRGTPDRLEFLLAAEIRAAVFRILLTCCAVGADSISARIESKKTAAVDRPSAVRRKILCFVPTAARRLPTTQNSATPAVRRLTERQRRRVPAHRRPAMPKRKSRRLQRSRTARRSLTPTTSRKTRGCRCSLISASYC